MAQVIFLVMAETLEFADILSGGYKITVYPAIRYGEDAARSVTASGTVQVDGNQQTVYHYEFDCEDQEFLSDTQMKEYKFSVDFGTP